MATPLHLKSLQALELAVRTGSFTLAGQSLGITPAAVGQRVKALEDYLGVELLMRGRSGIRPTAELTAALPQLTRAFAELEGVAQTLDLQRGQELHIAAASDFAELWLKPRLSAFRAAHPNIRFCINGAGEAPMRLGKVDCEIAFGPIDAGGDARDLLFRDFVLPIGSPDNVARTAPLADTDRLEGFPLLHLDFYRNDPAGLSWPDWIAANGIARTAPERGMRFQRVTAALDAVRANAGISLCGLALITGAIDDGTIALPYPVSTGLWSDHGYTARFRTDSLARRHVGQFRSWLEQESRETIEWLSRKAKIA